MFKQINSDMLEGAIRTPTNRKKSLEGLCVSLFVRYPSHGRIQRGAIDVRDSLFFIIKFRIK